MHAIEEQVVKPTVRGLQTESIQYRGFVFIGLMIDGDNPYVIEYNVRMGDPETEAIFPRLKTSMLDLLEAMADGTLDQMEIDLDDRTAATIFLVSGGYPGDIEKGKSISLPDQLDEHQWLFHAGTKALDGKIVTNGGRVIAVTSLGSDISSALEKSKKLAAEVQFEGKFHRNDIGMDLIRLQS